MVDKKKQRTPAVESAADRLNAAKLAWEKEKAQSESTVTPDAPRDNTPEPHNYPYSHMPWAIPIPVVPPHFQEHHHGEHETRSHSPKESIPLPPQSPSGGGSLFESIGKLLNIGVTLATSALSGAMQTMHGFHGQHGQPAGHYSHRTSYCCCSAHDYHHGYECCCGHHDHYDCGCCCGHEVRCNPSVHV